jgi:hypothetical protein
MAKSAYKYFTAPSYDFSASNKTVFTVGASHEASVSLSNAAKLGVGTEMKGGLSSSIKFGPEIEFKHSWTTKYEIDLEKTQIKDTKADTTNVYNAAQFRVTAGELGPDVLNQIDAAVTAKAQNAAYFALLLQLAATSLTISTAVKANMDASDANPDVAFWGGRGGEYWGSWSTSLIDGLSWVSLATAWFAGSLNDGNKRKTPERHKNFINMDHNAGIMLGVQSANTGFGTGSWYLQKQGSVEIGSYESMGFNAALTSVVLDPATRTTKKPARLSLSYRRVLIEAGSGAIVNSVPKGAFVVRVADVANPRLLLDKDNSFVRIPGQVGANYGLEMQSGRVKLSLDAETDLDLGTGGMVKLRKGAGTSLELKENEATLTSQAINLAATGAVDINGAVFKTGLVKIGDLQVLLAEVTGVATRAAAVADSTARTVANVANDARQRTEALAEDVAGALLTAQSEVEQETAELKSQIEYLSRQIRRLKG